MKHRLARVSKFEDVGNYEVTVVFNDGTKKKINFEPVLHGELFGPLRDIEKFKQIDLDQEVGTIYWPNGADFDPDTLYHWDEVVEELSAQLKRHALAIQGNS